MTKVTWDGQILGGAYITANTSNVITLAELDKSVQLALRNIVGSPLSLGTRVDAYNRVMDFLQSKANWNFTKRLSSFDYLNNESDYSIYNSLGITDFKQIQDLRIVKNSISFQGQKFEEIDSNEMAMLLDNNQKINVYSFEDRDNDKILRINTDQSQGDTIVDSMEDLTTGRTWSSDTVNSGATTLIADSTRVKIGSSCLKFNIDVTQSANNYARIYTSVPFNTLIDATDLENNGYFRTWLGLHSLNSLQLSYINNIELRWGTDSSNYWSATTSTAINNGAFKAGWNRLNFNWDGATKVGNPTASALTYTELLVNYSSLMTSCNNIRVDEIKMFSPLEAELVYFSNFMVVTTTFILQKYFTSGIVDVTEAILMPSKHFNLFKNLALQILWPQKEKKNDDYLRVISEIKEQLPLAVNQDGNPITREKNEFQLREDSSGRDDLSNNQW